MPRIRQQNILAAQWTANGGALGAADLTTARGLEDLEEGQTHLHK